MLLQLGLPVATDREDDEKRSDGWKAEGLHGARILRPCPPARQSKAPTLEIGPAGEAKARALRREHGGSSYFPRQKAR